MSFGNTMENQILALLLNGTAIAGIADNAASGALTNLYISLHTADPGEAGAQNTSEAAYSGYTRMAIPRTTSGFAAPSGGSSALASNVDFPASGGSGTTITHFSVGTASSGAGQIIGSGALNNAITIAAGVIPRVAAGSTFSVD